MPLTHTFRKLEDDWHDVDRKMLHACFDFFCDYVEKEYDGIEDPSLKEHYEINNREEIYSEIVSLYLWWRSYDESNDDHELETKNLLRLISIRGHLWT